jgi:hypothetical protein
MMRNGPTDEELEKVIAELEQEWLRADSVLRDSETVSLSQCTDDAHPMQEP